MTRLVPLESHMTLTDIAYFGRRHRVEIIVYLGSAVLMLAFVMAIDWLA
jgi:hypothetical protein